MERLRLQFTNTTIGCINSKVPQAIRPIVFMHSKRPASSEMPHELQRPPKPRYAVVHFIYGKSDNGAKEKIYYIRYRKDAKK